ncbi:LuxR C-terminal-related transcriptional regulator [Methylocella sp.]|uniref:helix-turn-helix transcriptional regulator n=1 Tax=Methylocella sp. TaxID=1978226 RepID=UPI0035B33098
MLRLDDKRWFDKLGQVAKSIGSRDFHPELVSLFGASIRHDSCWIIRFSRNESPEVLYTNNVKSHVVGAYLGEYSGVDPFSDYWNNHGHAGVIMLAKVKAEYKGIEAYSRVFLPNARISDEMSVFLPTVGNDCYGLFLEREEGVFSRADVERARRVFPALEGCHRAHISNLFANAHKACELEFNRLADKPMLIQDRFGASVYSNDAWNEAVAGDRAINSEVVRLSARGEKTSALDGWIIKFEKMTGDFPLAPHGRMFVLERCNSAPAPGDFDTPSLEELTPRERDILSFMLRGCTTGHIAQALTISKGVVKNYKHRIYRKMNVDSERALVRRFAPFFSRIDI